MPTPKRPSYRRQKRAGRADTAFVEIAGKRHHLGLFDSDASWTEYHRLLAQLAETGEVKREDDQKRGAFTVSELALAYWQNHAENHYKRRDGSVTSTARIVQLSIKRLRKMYGPTPAEDFGPVKLKRLRDQMIEDGLARNTINNFARHIRDVFRWGVSEELVPADVLVALSSVRGLQAGRSKAKESKPVKPVPVAAVRKTQAHLGRQLAAVVELQLLTGARGGELLGLRLSDIETTGEVWSAEIRDHKGAWRGNRRVVYFGPKAQAVLKPFLSARMMQDHLFSPREAEAERRASDAKGGRREGQKPTPTKTARKVGDHYTPQSYARAIERAARKADVPHWHPHQLRHTRATQVRKKFGIEAAQVALGHSHAAVTELYAEADLEKAREIAAAEG